MVNIQTLENINPDRILEVFNLSFSDYIVPLSITWEQLEAKMKSENTRLDFSIGAFEDDRLIGFILHGYDVVERKKMLYNGGTGVIPSRRGNRLTQKMYEYILPVLQNNIDGIILEVITTNQPAIKTYLQSGFKINRELNCVKGRVDRIEKFSNYEIRELQKYEWPILCSFWDWQPSWQNSITAVENLKATNVSIGIFEKDKLLGYLIFNPKSKRIHQLAVDKKYRNRGIGRELLNYISRHDKEISMINIDEGSLQTLEFMKAVGLRSYVKQYEMELIL